MLLFLIVASTIALLQPLANTPPINANPPDEHARFLVPWYIYMHGTIPTGFEPEVQIPCYGFSYGLYNTFPYIVQGFTMRLTGLFTDSKLILLYVARFVNVLSGCGMAYIVYLISKELFEKRGLRWVFCFGIMFLPQNLFVHTYVNSDSMCLLATAMIVYAWIKAYREGFSYRNCLWLSGGIIICALSYYNAYGYILSSIFLFLAYFLKRENGKWHYDKVEMIKKGSFISIIVLAGISWWFIRCYILYDGDILGLATREKMAIEFAIEEVNPLTMNTYENMGYSVWEMIKETSFFDGMFTSFVACFGSMSIFTNIWIYRIYKIYFAAGILLCAVLPGPGGEKKKDTGRKTFLHVNMIFCIVLPIILLIYYAYTTDFQNQGRYILPALIPLMYFVTRGFEKMFLLWQNSRIFQICVWALVLFPVFCTLCVTYLNALPAYLQTGVVL